MTDDLLSARDVAVLLAPFGAVACYGAWLHYFRRPPKPHKPAQPDAPAAATPPAAGEAFGDVTRGDPKKPKRTVERPRDQEYAARLGSVRAMLTQRPTTTRRIAAALFGRPVTHARMLRARRAALVVGATQDEPRGPWRIGPPVATAPQAARRPSEEWVRWPQIAPLLETGPASVREILSALGLPCDARNYDRIRASLYDRGCLRADGETGKDAKWRLPEEVRR